MSYRVPKAFLVDMDGTMIDTEKFWVQSEAETAQKYGKVMPHELSIELIGVSVAHSGQVIVDALGLDITVDEFVEDMINNVVRHMLSDELIWRPGAKELLKYANENKIPIVLVTSSYTRLASIFVDKAKEVDGKGFDFYIAGDKVQNPKPHPEPYLTAAEKLGVNIEECIILEDSNSGINAGKASGGKTIAIPFMSKLEPIEGISWINSITELTPEIMDRVLSGELVDLTSK